MIHPPRPYKIVNNAVQGGFLLRDVDIIKQRNELNLKSNSTNLTKTTFYREYPKEKMQPMINAVNSYNSMPFIINQKVFEVRDPQIAPFLLYFWLYNDVGDSNRKLVRELKVCRQHCSNTFCRSRLSDKTNVLQSRRKRSLSITLSSI